MLTVNANSPKDKLFIEVLNLNAKVNMLSRVLKENNVPVKDEKQIGYMKNKDVKQTMFFRVESMRGSYRDENINTDVRGRYLSDMKLEDVL